MGQELLISSVATNTVLDRTGGLKGDGRLIACKVLRNDNQMVRMTHGRLLSLIIILVSGPLSAVTVATTSNTHPLGPTSHPKGLFKTDICYISGQD
jgi:hypothetical protein